MVLQSRRSVLDKSTGAFVSHTIFQLPGKLGKGVLVSPTVHGNTIVGPTAIDIEDREGTNTTAEGLNDLIEKAGATVAGVGAVIAKAFQPGLGKLREAGYTVEVLAPVSRMAENVIEFE